MVNFNNFIKLRRNDKITEILTKGTFLFSDKSVSITYNLYHLNDFYVEVILIEDKISKITPFKHGVLMDKYLKHIKI